MKIFVVPDPNETKLEYLKRRAGVTWTPLALRNAKADIAFIFLNW